MTSLAAAKGERALFRTVSAWGISAVTDDLDALDRSGFHVVVVTFEGHVRIVTMRHVRRHDQAPWWGGAECAAVPRQEPPLSWTTALDQRAYEGGVESVHEAIAAGEVYQVNLCRVLSAAMSAEHDPYGLRLDRLFARVLADNPAPYAARIDLAGADLDIVSASPELYLERHGRTVRSAPIKGTATTSDRLLAKDSTENIMITDLVRNDLQTVCEPGTVAVEGLLARQHHPGLVHLVSTVAGHLRDGVGWRDLLSGSFPPGSVSGVPKIRALQVITDLERTARGPYCGAIGWVDADRGTAELAVGIRTFWREGRGNEFAPAPIRSGTLHFGTGAGITWDSDPRGEWDETELKARRLLRLADGVGVEGTRT